MSKSARLILVTLVVAALGAALVLSGVAFGSTLAAPGGYNMMNGYGPYGTMMGQSGMMGNYAGQPYTSTAPYDSGMMGQGMMGGMMNGMMGGMMGSGSSELYGITPLSVEDARNAAQQYLAGLNQPDLVLGEVMVFDNNTYVQVLEQSTGLGAFEVLVDPATKAVLPEPGPNMMWNTKYGAMSSGMMNGGGMMGGTARPQAAAGMPLSREDATQAAQRYLDTYLPGAQAATDATQFYGYYTLDILRADRPVGMLSVNGYSGQVFVHTWHGDFVEMSEAPGG